MSSFGQAIILLLLTALISGLLVPLVINHVQTRNQQRLKKFEADVARQTQVITDQVSFLERLADALWAFELALIAPLYYGQSAFYQGQGTEGPYNVSMNKYLDNASDQLGLIRAEIGKAARLVPSDLWNELKALYYDQLLVLDLKATELFLASPSESNQSEWRSLHDRVLVDLANSIDTTIDRTAGVLSLKAI